MKTLMASLLISGLISGSAYAACPDLSGNYICKSGSHISQKSIEMTDKGYIFNSDGVEFEYLTDGVTYDVPANENQKDGKVKSYCQDDKFIVDFTTNVLYDGTVIGKQVSKTEYVLSQDGFGIVQKTKLKGLPIPTLKFQCTKN